MGDLAGQQRYSGQRQAFSDYSAVRTKPERPLPVTLIALLQLAKGLFLLLAAAVAHSVPDVLRNVPGLPALLYFAAHGRDVRGGLLPVVGVCVLITGYGLWRLWGWARRTLIFSSILMIGLWAYRFATDWRAVHEAFGSPLEEQTVCVLVFVDVVIVAYLACYDGVPQAFHREKAQGANQP